jgi:magnesium chelatase subunit D
VIRAGLLAEAAGGVLVLGAADRWSSQRIAPLIAAIDGGGCGIIACDEGAGDDEYVPAALLDRCALRVDFAAAGPAAADLRIDPERAARAAAARNEVTIDEETVESLCAVAVALGVESLRACLLACRVAISAAALAGRGAVSEADAAVAAGYVLAPRATRVPPAEAEAEPEPPAPEPAAPSPDTQQDDAGLRDVPPGDLILQAALAALPPDLLAQVAGKAPRRGAAGRAGARLAGDRRGRPIGSRRGDPRVGARLDLLATLRAAAPWQGLRKRAAGELGLRIRPDDLHVLRCRPRSQTTTIFAVDASGSQALARLAEAKGAVELLLAECYVRRDRVAVVGFRGAGATVLLPPTRAPARARRSLAGLPGGGATPLASGIEAATALAAAATRRGETATIVVLTDGQANMGRDGAPGREQAQRDALNAARALRAGGYRCLLIDTANRSQKLARDLAAALGGRYLALPRADAARLSGAIRAGR